MTVIRSEFAVHMLNAEGKDRARLLAEEFSHLLSRIEVECSATENGEAKSGDPRLLAIVRTKLEEACFFAKKCMASQKAHQEIAK